MCHSAMAWLVLDVPSSACFEVRDSFEGLEICCQICEPVEVSAKLAFVRLLPCPKFSHHVSTFEVTERL